MAAFCCGRSCEGFRMTAHRDDSACSGAVVRKTPMKETALGGTWGGAAGSDLSGIDACCCRHLPAQLLRYGTNVANGWKTAFASCVISKSYVWLTGGHR